MSSKDEDAGDELSWDSVFKQVNYKNLRGDELKTSAEVNLFAFIGVVGSLKDMRRIEQLRVVSFLVIVAIQNQHKIRWIVVNFEKIEQDAIVGYSSENKVTMRF